ncbi:MAG TPA: hypothetical protein VFK96_10305 [Gammaproteobacteria bacterium]|nr:hypothetical protein [Gammaproteobacteria bacterium]
MKQSFAMCRGFLEHFAKFSIAELLNIVLPRRKALAELRAQWGKPGTSERWLASEYFDLLRHGDASVRVDDKTYADLEMAAIFSSLDATVTPVGSQVLFRRLRTYDLPDELAARYSVYTRLQSDVALREELQLRMLRLKDESNACIADFIFGELPPTPKYQSWLFLWSLLSIVVLAAVIVLSWSVWIWIAVVFVNVAVMYRVYSRTLRDGETLTGCLRLVKVADDLASSQRNSWLPQLTELCDERRNRNDVVRTLRWWRSIFKIPFVEPAVALLNAAFLVDLLVHFRAMKQFARVRHKLAASFKLVGEIDAAIAVASWLDYCPKHCRPTLINEPVLEISDGRHPLLTNGVANSILLDQRSILVTGSNMAGKTTFIKMIGVNALLAQTLGFCLASKATIPRARIMASIQARHSVGSGKSHYFSEVETIQSLLAQKEQGDCAIFVVDELFSGTNTVERVAIARAVLESLSELSLVLATTHDVELQAVLKDHYDLYHFQESPDVDGFFDYKLRRGATTKRNAIRLLKEMGFPGEIIAKAMTYAKQQPEQALNDTES